MFQSVPHGVKVSIEGTIGDQVYVNTFHVDVHHEVTPTDLESVANAINTWWTSDVAPSVTSDLIIEGVRAVDLEHNPPNEFLFILSPPAAGTATSTSLPANAALVTTLLTSYIGRSYRGRSYLGGLPATQQASVATMELTYATAIAGVYDSLITGLNSLGYALSVCSRVAEGVLRVTGILTEVIGVITNNRIDTQRRRVNNGS